MPVTDIARRQNIDLRDFNVTGADQDYSSEIALAVAQADAHATDKAKLYFPRGRYGITETITIPDDVEVECENSRTQFNFDPADRSTSPACFSLGSDVRFRGGTVNLVGGDPASPDTTNPVAAYRLTGQRSLVEDVVAQNLEYGILLHAAGASQGVAYNKILHRNISGCYQAIRLYADATCWVNENTFLAGRCHHSAATPPTGSCGIFMDAAGTEANGNKFFGQSVEGNGFDYAVRLRGQDNAFYNLRNEIPNKTATIEVADMANGSPTINNDWWGSTASLTLTSAGSYRVDAIYFHGVNNVTRGDSGHLIPGLLLPQNMPEVMWLPESHDAYFTYNSTNNRWEFWRLGSRRFTVNASGNIGLNGADAVQGSAIVDADGTLADITTKFNALLAFLRTRKDIAT